ncbi:MAG TPA: hypothetical protein VIF62_33935, partial [Labilithrix sp.]
PSAPTSYSSEMPRVVLGRIVAIGAAAVWLAVACSSFESTETTTSDAGDREAGGGGDDAMPPADGSTNDAGADASPPTCAIGTVFVANKKIDGVNTPDYESIPRVSHDERVIYFRRSPLGGAGKLYRAARAKVGDAFDVPVAVGGISTTFSTPWLTPDELTVYFDDDTLANPAVFATRKTSASDFPAPTPWQIAGASPVAPVFREDLQEVFYALGTPSDLWSAAVTDGGYADAAVLGTLNSNGNDQEPAISADGLELFFYTEKMRASDDGTIYWTSRDTRSSPWRTPQKIGELEPDSGAQFTSPGTISPDHCRLYYYASTDPSAGWELYVAERAPAGK